jgi:hypothetical protein
MKIREVLDRRVRLLDRVAAGWVCAVPIVAYGTWAGITWLVYLYMGLFPIVGFLFIYWVKCPRCRGRIGIAKSQTRARPRKEVRFMPGDVCPYCGVSLEEPWEKAA